ncbi:MAG: inositol monophosphatase family protein [Candidatus Omnitrophica bacterium]|nr:inositol monophosphatase family protein [Candidatus Omnitrophota bacterium]
MEERILKIAEEAALEAGKYAFSRIGSTVEISHKGARNNLVTDVDKASEKIIIGKVTEAFPGHGIVAEESGELLGSGYTWVIDPLDGTTNYAHAFPFFCVSIGVMKDGKPLVGVVYDPSRNELFSAVAGGGASLNGRKIKVSGIRYLEDSLIATGFAYNIDMKMENLGYLSRMLEISQAVRRAGSAALDLCYVACGRFDGFWEMGLNPWDTAAGSLVVMEAGGIVTTMQNSHFDIYARNIVATNGLIHSQVISTLKS